MITTISRKYQSGIKERLDISAFPIMVMSCAVAMMILLTVPAFAQREDVDMTPVDLTKLVQTAPKNTPVETAVLPDEETGGDESTTNATGASSDAAPATAASPNVTSLTSVSASSSLTRKDPSSIRLGSLGLDRPDLDGLNRLMWEGSNAATALALMTSLDPARSPNALRPVLDHIMTARSVPPEGFIDIAPDIINAKLNWLASSGASDDLAAIIRQLPESDIWEDQKAWLILHDLMTRNDEAACLTAQKKVLMTLDVLWHQINAFCAVIKGEEMKAAFALDILEDSGVDDPVYFALMRRLINGDDVTIDDQTELSMLNVILMDSARLMIEADVLKALPYSYSGTAQRLRYLSPSASRFIAARAFNHVGADGVAPLMQSWALVPRDNLSSAEALTRLRFGGDADTIALARLNTWQAIAAEKDELSGASLAFEAMLADFSHADINAIALWLPLIEAGINAPEIDAKIGPLMGFGAEGSKVLMNDAALAWHDLLATTSRPVSPASLAVIDAYDAIPLIMARGRPIGDIEWMEAESLRPLAVGASLPYTAIKKIEAAAADGLKAETILRLAHLLQEYPLSRINRDDAAKLVNVLMQLDMQATAQHLARDLLVTWGANRHFAIAGGAQ